MQNFPPILFAVGWETIVFVLVFILYAIGQAITESKKKKQQAGQRPRIPQQARHIPQQPKQAAAQQPPPHDQLRQQVDEFLRRAGRKADDLGPGPAPKRAKSVPSRKKVEVETDIELVDEPMPSSQLAKSSGEARPPIRRVSRTPEASPHYESVAEHVAEHISSQSITERSSHLGEDVALADEKIEAHLHHKFDRDLGTLKPRRVEEVAETSRVDSLAAEVAAMLADPQGMRQAIVLGEILRRPDHTW